MPPSKMTQSTANHEYGSDAAARGGLDPTANFEVMIYCSPRWISPVSCKVMITTAVTNGIDTGP